ncbi:polyhomeotic-like protein 3 isoform X1 [Oryzias melastigma]|uniref:Polyhomeotic-like protein 3 n=1 Tax=Oryzias melastigma TaxID=30732 RepID=A0A3B3BIN2_ORYME|nr:polyhomeotic-like protein 3 isoform X1 [Oryzias melastigma]XP_024137876.1 polyhomeotic-like protein 3 isoform X1 [Oryzias melastigma]
MMDQELQIQSEQATNGASPQAKADPSTPATPTPPRLTPNPMLLDSPAPMLTPITSSPPPPLTPAPSLSAAHRPKTAAGALSPHVLVPAPPKLTSTTTPTLRTYSRPILPSPATTSKTSPSAQTSTSPLLPPSSSSSSAVTATSSSPLSSSSSSLSNTSTKTSTSMTNGSSRPANTSTPITPFHTPASPPGRQVSQAHPAGTPGPVRANQSPPVRQRVSQQTLLLGKGLKGSGQDQVLLRAQMLILTSAMRPAPSSSSSSIPSSNPASAQLQSLTLRPSLPGTLTIPPTLRLKPPSSIPPPLSRPNTPLFPPLRPRPQPSTTPTESPTTPIRHLPVPPPTLYSPVRAVPLKPRLHSPNSHRVTSPRQSFPLQPIAAAPSSQAPPTSRPLKSCPLTQTMLGPGQSQHRPLSVNNHFECSPSAARQLQIIALSSGRQSVAVPQPTPPAADSPDLSSQSKRTVSAEDRIPLPLNSMTPKAASSRTSPPSVQSLASPLNPQTLTQRGEEPEERSKRMKTEDKDEGKTTRDVQVGTGDQREKVKEEVEMRCEDQMEVTEEGRRAEEEETPMDQSEVPLQHQTTTPETVKDSREEIKPAPDPVLEAPPEPAVLDQNQRLPEPHRDLQPVSHEDFCENMSTQSDNQSALSSLSSQSPPSSPFVTPAAENPAPPPLLPQSDQPADLRVPQPKVQKLSQAMPDSQPAAETELEHLDQSEDESESFDQSLNSPWEPRAWPEGRKVLTHLVEGFVIQEGLQPFPVNRSSLLVPEQVTKPQEVNGTNGKAALPETDATKQRENSTDSEEEEGGDTDNTGTRAGHRDRTVLHCQFCGKRGHAHNFMRSKRFCSTSCARGFNVRLTKRLRALSAGSRTERPRPALNRAESVPGKPLLLRLPRDLWSAGRREKEGKEKPGAAAEQPDKEVEELGGFRGEDEDNGPEEDPAVAMTARMDHRAARRARRASAPAVTTSTPTTTFRPAPSQWSVEEVTAFIHTLPGCSDVAEAFRLQEIDGQALLLLTEDHLMSSMNIKLGPALKICAHINALKNQ